MDGRHSGRKNVAVIEGWLLNRGFLSTILNGDAVGTKASGRYREVGCLSGVAVKRGSTVHTCSSKHDTRVYAISDSTCTCKYIILEFPESSLDMIPHLTHSHCHHHHHHLHAL